MTMNKDECLHLCEQEVDAARPYARAGRLASALEYCLMSNGRVFFVNGDEGNYLYDTGTRLYPVTVDGGSFTKLMSAWVGLPSTSKLLAGAVEILRSRIPDWKRFPVTA